MKRFVGLILIATGISGAAMGEDKTVTTTILGDVIWQPCCLTFGYSGIVINAETGDVTIPPGVMPDDAAKQFWNTLAQIRGRPLPFPSNQ